MAVDSIMNDDKFMAARLCSRDKLASTLKRHAKLLHFDAGQLIQIEGDDEIGIMIVVEGKARAFVRSDISKSMDKSLDLAGFLRKLKQDMRLNNSLNLLYNYGIDSLKKRLVNYKYHRKQPGEELSKHQYDELAQKVLQVQDSCLSFKNPSSKGLEAQRFMKRAGSLREFSPYEEFLTRRLYLTVP